MSNEQIESNQQRYADTEIYISPILAILQTNQMEVLDNCLQAEITQCELCPNSIWILDSENPICYCQTTHSITYDTQNNQKIIYMCDSKEISIKQIQQQEH